MNEASNVPRDVTVIGGGVVGVCCALYLQREGHHVTVFDPEGPGEGCSLGSAGQFVAGYCAPVGMPGMVKKVPGMLADPLGPLTIRWPYLPRLLPWLVRFVAASSRKRVEAIADALYALNENPMQDFQPLVEQAAAEHLVASGGRLEVYRTQKAFEKAKPKHELLSNRGVKVQYLNAQEISDLEPALAGRFDRAVWLVETSYSTNPYQFVQLLAEDFVRQGGQFVRERVTGFTFGRSGPSTLVTTSGRHPLDQLVLAAGAFSRDLAVLLGSKIPLDTERGYHVMLPQSGIELQRTLVSGDYYFALTPMEEGLRLAGTVEFASIHAAPNYDRADQLLKVAREIFPEICSEGSTQWMGCRPSLPDSLPVIGRSAVHDSVYFAFGHGHLGLTGAAMTGKLIADLVAGRPTCIDIAPFRAERFCCGFF